MAERPCQNTAPHDGHHWYPAPFESDFRGVSHHCAGIAAAEDQTPTALAEGSNP